VACGGDLGWDEGAFFDDGKADGFAGTFEGVSFTIDEARATLDFANRAPRDVLDEHAGIGARAAQNIADARPLPTVRALADVPTVGPATLARLKSFAPGWVKANPPEPSCGTGGRFDGEAFSAAEECKALDVANTAGYLQLAPLPGYGRRVLYDRRPWLRLADVAATYGVGPETMKALRLIALEWVVGASGMLDTVAHLVRVGPAGDGARAPQVTIERGRILSRVAGTPCAWLADADQEGEWPRIQLCAPTNLAGSEQVFDRALAARVVVRVRAAYRVRENGGRYLQGYASDFVRPTAVPLR
jgi:hypothetical protein